MPSSAAAGAAAHGLPDVLAQMMAQEGGTEGLSEAQLRVLEARWARVQEKVDLMLAVAGHGMTTQGGMRAGVRAHAT